jgi:hypothetical protein
MSFLFNQPTSIKDWFNTMTIERKTCCAPSCCPCDDDEMEQWTPADKVKGMFLLGCDYMQECEPNSSEFYFYKNLIDAYSEYGRSVERRAK